MLEKECTYTYNDTKTTFNLNVDIYPQEDLELVIYDFLIVSKDFNVVELQEIEKLSGETFMRGLNIN
jgi:hypothetical protein